MKRALALLLGVAACAAPVLTTPLAPSRWSYPPVSSAHFESHPAFDPRTGALVFVRSSPQFSGWRLYISACGSQGWAEPIPVFAGDGVEADPFFTRDGASLYFISSRSESGVRQHELDIWRVVRTRTGSWGEPERLPEPVNSEGNEWFPRLTSDGWLYFGSDRPGGAGATDIYRTRMGATGAWMVEHMGPALNTAGDEYEVEISAAGDRMILMADGDLYESRRHGSDWSPRMALGPDINTQSMEVGPLLSPDGRGLLFARDSGDPAHSGEIYLFNSAAGGARWPPSCPG